MSRSVDDRLGRAVAAHRAGQIAEAIALYKGVLQLAPDHVEALQLCGTATLKQGDASAALPLLERALARDPEHVPALLNHAAACKALGRLADADRSLVRAASLAPDRYEPPAERARVALLEGRPADARAHATLVADRWPERPDGWRLLAAAAMDQGDPAAAATALLRALAVAPTDAGARADLALALWRTDRLAEALIEADRAVDRAPQSAPIRLRRAQIRAAAGHPEVEVAFRTALGLDPRHAPTFVAFGAWLRERGRDADALVVYERAPTGIPEVCLGVGNARRALGEVDAARVAWREALALRPAYVEAAHNLGASLAVAGDSDEGLELLALAARSSAEHWPWIALVDAIGRARRVPASIESTLIACLTRPGLDHQQLERPIRAILARQSRVAEALASGVVSDETAARLAVHPLFRDLLGAAIVVHPDWERLILGVRDRVAAAAAEGRWPAEHVLQTAIALARQAWYTEYAASEPLPRDPGGAAEPIALAVAAMYGPVAPNDHPALGGLVREQILDPAAELAAAAAMPTLAMSQDATSAAVRAMYEENPYPRLVSMHRKPAEPIAMVLKGVFPSWSGPWPGDERGLDILVAGCGTGQQPLAAATRYVGARVTAIDLSRRSLAAAKRRADAWGLDVAFAQADILALGGLPDRYHLVEAGGVLHHLADPMAGWRILAGLLVPRGWMKIGLYAERGRPAVIAARALVAELDLQPTPAGLRAARRAILALPEDHPARALVYSIDFYSLSGLRDLVFHVQEHRFTLPQLAECLEQLKLDLVGFQHARPEPLIWYGELFPGDEQRVDLARWAAVERAHPEAFAGMYQFWACARGGEDAGRRG